MMLAIAFLLAVGASAAPSGEVADIRVSSGRIVSGWEANEGDFPYALALRMSTNDGLVTSCVGVILHHEWGLTAGHCTTIRVTIIIRAGSVTHLTPQVIFETTDFYHPPSFIQGVFLQSNDISLLKFNRFLEYSANIQPLRIQPRAQKDDDYGDNILRIAGWGTNATSWRGGEYPEVLNWVYLIGMSNQQCRAHLFNSGLLADFTICAMAYNVTSQSPCEGDSGAPLLLEDVDGKPTLVGITSFSSGYGCEAHSPSGYVRPGHYHDWLSEVSGINFDWDPESIAVKEEDSIAKVDVAKVLVVESAET